MDYETNASLAGVNIYDSSKVYTASTDNAGNFLIKNIPPGKYDFTFSFIGYLKQNISVDINNSVTFKIIKLIPAPVTLGEVTVTSTKTDMTIKDTPLPMEI
ncbi:MAG: carboxypeptidase-like regulatory domain-containing protein, partial [Ignavibacteriaceae bacterium]